MRRYLLPYWAFVPTLGVWPDARSLDGTGTAETRATVPLPPASGAVAVDLEKGVVSVKDVRPENTSAVPPERPFPVPAKQQYPNTPSVGGPSKLRKATAAVTTTMSAVDPVTRAAAQNASRPVGTPVTKIYLKPSARAKAGVGGVALSNPISTAVVRRGDTISIEYLPDATAEAGDGGVAISRPELVIHFVD